MAAILLAWPPPPVWAHGADANTADIRLAGETAYVVVWPAAEVFAEFDDNGDGLIQPSETRAHRDEMLELFRANFILRDAAGRAGETIFEDLSTPMARPRDPDAGAEHLRVTLRKRWETPPETLVLHCTLVGRTPMTVRSARVTATKLVHDQQILAPPQTTVFDRKSREGVVLGPGAKPDSE